MHDQAESAGHAGREVTLTTHRLAGFLAIPAQPCGVVLFAHGSGSSRFSPRNAMVARRLNGVGVATLLFDLLSVEESGLRRTVFDITLLTERLSAATQWARAEADIGALPLGYFGASTGAAAALTAAAELGETVSAIVSRGGRPDLAAVEHLRRVRAPTLLIVGSRDELVLRLNRQAMAEMRCEAKLEIIGGATHLFEEAGALERVSDMAADWFVSHFQSPGQGSLCRIRRDRWPTNL